MIKFNPNTLAHKIERMVERIDSLARFQDYTLEQDLAEDDIQIIVERLLELVIQSALDINRALLKQLAGKRIEKNSDTFIEAGKAGFIPEALAKQIAPSGGFRNVLAHEYDELIPETVFDNFKEALEQYPAYLEAIQVYLDSLEEDDDRES